MLQHYKSAFKQITEEGNAWGSNISASVGNEKAKGVCMQCQSEFETKKCAETR